MALPKLAAAPAAYSLLGAHSFVLGQVAWHYRPGFLRSSRTPNRHLTVSARRPQQQQQQQREVEENRNRDDQFSSTSSDSTQPTEPTFSPQDASNFSLPAGWEDSPQLTNVSKFSDLPHRFFGYNQHIKINEDFKESLRQILWQFRAPIRYAFAYGSGVFGQSTAKSSEEAEQQQAVATSLSPHPNPPKAVEEWQKGGGKVIDFIFGVSHTQHWHSLNLQQHPGHYSGLRFAPYSSAVISAMQDEWGAGVYFNPYITVNGTMVKYGVVNLDTLAQDLGDWNTLYLAGRLQKPVKILRDDPRIRLANQINLLSALRAALLMLPEKFNERELYEKIAGLSYLGDPRMMYIPGLGASENLDKVKNIVGAQLPGFRQLYVPLIENLPNVEFTDSRTPRDVAWEKEDAIRHTGIRPDLKDVLGGSDGLELTQAMDPFMRGNMVRRLPPAFRRKVYYRYKSKFQIPGSAFDSVLAASEDEESASGALQKRQGGGFEQRIAAEHDLSDAIARSVQSTVSWPATTQTIKSFFTAGVGKAWRYYSDKRKKSKEHAAATPGEVAKGLTDSAKRNAKAQEGRDGEKAKSD